LFDPGKTKSHKRTAIRGLDAPTSLKGLMPKPATRGSGWHVLWSVEERVDPIVALRYE